MTKSDTNNEVPEYDATVYEFEEGNMNGLADFLESNPTLRCII